MPRQTLTWLNLLDAESERFGAPIILRRQFKAISHFVVPFTSVLHENLPIKMSSNAITSAFMRTSQYFASFATSQSHRHSQRSFTITTNECISVKRSPMHCTEKDQGLCLDRCELHLQRKAYTVWRMYVFNKNLIVVCVWKDVYLSILFSLLDMCVRRTKQTQQTMMTRLIAMMITKKVKAIPKMVE